MHRTAIEIIKHINEYPVRTEPRAAKIVVLYTKKLGMAGYLDLEPRASK